MKTNVEGKGTSSIVWGLSGPWQLQGESGQVIEWRKRAWAEVTTGSERAPEDRVFATPPPVSWASAVRDELSLLGATGEISRFDLTGFDLECRSSHELMVISATPLLGYRRLRLHRKLYVAVCNHTTQKTFFCAESLSKIFVPSSHRLMLGSSVLSASLYGVGIINGAVSAGLALALVGGPILLGARRLRAFKRNTLLAASSSIRASFPSSEHPAEHPPGAHSITGR